jgi:hypothetical protein
MLRQATDQVHGEANHFRVFPACVSLPGPGIGNVPSIQLEKNRNEQSIDL